MSALFAGGGVVSLVLALLTAVFLGIGAIVVAGALALLGVAVARIGAAARRSATARASAARLADRLAMTSPGEVAGGADAA